MSVSAEQAAHDLRAVLATVKHGSLRMFGDWFGRPMDNIHVVRSADAQGDDLIVGFDEAEVLTISDPDGWIFNEEVFRVSIARRVTWRWYSYGRPKLPENLFTIEHWMDESGDLRARSDVDWSSPVFTPSVSEPAAELL